MHYGRAGILPGLVSRIWPDAGVVKNAVRWRVKAPAFLRQPARALQKADEKLIDLMHRFGVPALRIALALIFFWFGALKTFGGGPAEDLVRRTVYWFKPEVFIPVLGIWEMLIGVCLVFPSLVRVGLLLLFVQLPGTFLPLVLLPEVCFVRFPFGLTMEVQYIVKNLLIIASALVVGGSVRAMRISAARSQSPDRNPRVAP